MNLFLHEMKQYWKYLLFWSIGIVAMVGGGMGKFTALYDTSDTSITDVFNQLPKAFLAMFGMVNLEVTSLSGFYGVINFYLVIMGAIFAIILGAGILAKEERDKTAEFLLVKPVTRTWVLGQKLAAGLIYVLAFVGIDYLVSVAIIAKVAPNEDISTELFLMMVGLTLVMLSFYCLSFGLSGALKNNTKASMIMISVMGASYIGTVMYDMIENSEWLRPTLIFKYFPNDEVIRTLSLDPMYVGLTVVWIIVGLALAFVRFPRRDIHI
ncbi:MAG: ABC transporter permease subunit [Ignavibacteria bacterium]|nr:ABC transporter permease subunit [Ignavibacteria bacterium]